ncbi:hypothetical protein E2542_SST29392 [Spatholobus suberectus]|nr:hypothetical protein E2542_SST29392 [Spatholobus suberectus]
MAILAVKTVANVLWQILCNHCECVANTWARSTNWAEVLTRRRRAAAMASRDWKGRSRKGLRLSVVSRLVDFGSGGLCSLMVNVVVVLIQEVWLDGWCWWIMIEGGLMRLGRAEI